MSVTCPITRDNTTNPWSSVSVVVIDQTTAAGVCCRPLSLSPDGNTGFSPATLCTVPPGFISSVGKSISFGPLGAVNDGYFTFNCVIPPRQSGLPASGVTSYRIVEF